MTHHPLFRAPRVRTAVALAAITLAALISSCAAQGAPGSSQGVRAVGAAQTMLGRQYVYGGSRPETGFDCSGLTSWAWSQAGKTIPRTATDQYRTAHRVGRADLIPGDLVFYGYGGNIQHVGIYVGNGRMVSASNPSRPVELVGIDSWWTQALVGYGRI